jgi:hypothetical protein
MKNLILVLAIAATGLLTIGADSGQGGGCANSGVHGELSTGATVNPQDPTNVNVNIGGKIVFAKRPLTPAEKAEIFKTAHDAAITCWTGQPNDCNEKHEITKLIDRARYRYRVTWKTVRPFVDAGWLAGRKEIWSP